MNSTRIARHTPPRGRGLAASLLACATVFAADPVTSEAWQRIRARSADTLDALARENASADTAGDDARAVPLTFDRFFQPVGDEGLAFTAQAKALAGRRVKVTGFMVREPSRAPGVFLLVRRRQLAPADASVATADLPPAVIYVHLPADAAATPVPFVPGRVTVAGVLELGPRPEPGGRNSVIRLRLDAMPDFAPPRPAPASDIPQP